MSIIEITMVSGAKHYIKLETMEHILYTSSELCGFVDIKTHENITIFVNKLESYKELKGDE